MPGEIRSKFGVTQLGGKVVRAFPWKEHGTKTPIAQMWGASTKISDLFSAAKAKFAEIDRSSDYTASGRSAAKRAWAKANGGVMKEAAAAAVHADAALKGIRSMMASFTVDKTDVVGQMRQAEIRSLLRSLPNVDRDRLLMDLPTDRIDPEIAAAVFSGPAVLSGVSEKQREQLMERAMAAQHPMHAEQIELVTAASEALGDVVEATADMLRSSGLSPDDVSELIGEPTYAERIAGMMPPAEGQAA